MAHPLNAAQPNIDEIIARVLGNQGPAASAPLGPAAPTPLGPASPTPAAPSQPDIPPLVARAQAAGTAPAATPSQNVGGVGTQGEADARSQVQERLPGVPDFKTNPLGAIGFLMQQAAAGFEGRETPLQRAQAGGVQQQKFDLEREGLELQRAGVVATSIEQMTEVLRNAPRASHPAIIEQFGGIGERLGVPLRDFAEAASEGLLTGLENAQAYFKDNSPAAGAAVFGIPGFYENQTPAQASQMAQDAMEFHQGLTQKVAEQEKLLPGQLKKARGEAEIEKEFREPKAPVLRQGLGGATINIDTDEVVTPGSLNVIVRATGEQKTIPIRSAEDLKRLTDQLASGEITEGRVQLTQEVTDIPGAIRILLPDLPADMTPEQARLKGINIDLRPETLEGLLESRGDVQQLDSTFTELQNFIVGNPASVGTAGFFARVGNSIMAQLPLIAQLAGTEIDPELIVLENYEETFKDIGVTSQRGRSATFGAAYALALAQRRRGGRVAQQDIERALGQIGGTFGQDPAATIQVLQDLKQRTSEGFQTRATAMLGQSPARIEVTPSPAISKRGAIPEGIRIPEGHEFVRMQDGKAVVRNKAGQEFIQD